MQWKENEAAGVADKKECLKAFKELRRQWDQVYQNGQPDAMWTDGIALNHIRTEIIKLKCANHTGIAETDIPPEVAKDYMAKKEKIRSQATQDVQAYRNNADYLFLLKRLPQLSIPEKKKSGILTALGKVQNLIQSVERDDLVIMREYGNNMQFLDLLQVTAEQVKKLPVRKAKAVKEKNVKEKPKKEPSVTEEDSESWHLEGQISIFDIAA